jgi:hypothetical protein
MKSNLRTLYYIIWMAPIWAYIGFFLIRLLWAFGQIWSSLAVTTFGILLAVVAGFALIALLIKIAPFQLLLGVACLFITHGIFILSFMTSYTLFVLPTVFAVYNTTFSLYAIKDALTLSRWRNLFGEFRAAFKDPLRSIPKSIAITKDNLTLNQKSKSKSVRNPNRTKHYPREKATISIVILIIIGFMVPFLLISKDNPEGSQTFVITNAQAESYDLVVYFPDYNVIDTTVCDIFVEANATLSFPLTEDRFDEADPEGLAAAAKVQLLNSYDIKVEVWPLFEWEEGSYPSLAEIDRWEMLYEKFDNWTNYNAINVDYLLWDIESGGEGLAEQYFKYWIQPFNYIGEYAAQCQYLQERAENWTDALEVIHNISQRCDTDGHIMRTTTHTIIWDLFDGDSDIQKQSGLPVWDATENFEYISMMAYRGCEGGGDCGTSDMIYEVIRASKLTQPGSIAVCLGCINYTPYPDIPSVKSDVLLSLAAGCDSVRLFQANSWINGVGEGEGPWGPIHGGPAHGLDGESGLRQLLQACRTGGSVTYTPTKNMRNSVFISVLMDVLYDLSKL